jgi:hypothetical protein
MTEGRTGDRSPLERAELDAFSCKLVDLMARNGLSQSDLARAIWGTLIDPRGRDVARNRDRISNYVRGLQLPSPATVKKLADVFGVEPAELQPSLAVPPGQVGQPVNISLTAISGRPDVVLLTVNKRMPMKIALQILALLAEADVQGDRDAP